MMCWSLFINFLDIDYCLHVIYVLQYNIVMVGRWLLREHWDVAWWRSWGSSGSLLFFSPHPDQPDPDKDEEEGKDCEVDQEGQHQPGEKTGAAPLWDVRSQIVLAHHPPWAGREDQVRLVLAEHWIEPHNSLSNQIHVQIWNYGSCLEKIQRNYTCLCWVVASQS